MRDQLISIIDTESFLRYAQKIPVIDVRSPSEYNTGHVPGAFNIPLFDDKERETVGVRYKNAGQLKAILTGLEIVGPELSLKLEDALKTAVEGELLLYCWRGGMRSEAMAWLFSLGGLETKILEGGYKAYRNHILRYLTDKRKMIILGGLTGSGKTQILRKIKLSGNHVIDLEDLANHNGSAFGALGHESQPSSEYFANLLFEKLKHISCKELLWLEDESRNIGNVFMPGCFYINMQENPVIVLLMDQKIRLPKLIKEYSSYPVDELKDCVMKISKRLGAENTKETIHALEKHDFARAIKIILDYYDKAYLYGLKRKINQDIYYIHSETDDVEINTQLVLETTAKIDWGKYVFS